MAKINWPSLRSYTGEHLQRIALPLGGIGTGTVSLGGRGNLTDWEIMTRPG
jgi:non-lysosomal glucosylceramidase